MLPAFSFSLVSSSHSYDETITYRHPRNDAAACVRCVLHPLPLPLSSCLGCIPPLIGLPFLRFYAVVSSLFLLFSFFLSGRVFLFFPPCGHEPPPILPDRLNPNLSLERHCFPIPRYAKRPDVALYTVGPLFLLPTPSSPHCAIKVSARVFGFRR